MMNSVPLLSLLLYVSACCGLYCSDGGPIHAPATFQVWLDEYGAQNPSTVAADVGMEDAGSILQNSKKVASKNNISNRSISIAELTELRTDTGDTLPLAQQTYLNE